MSFVEYSISKLINKYEKIAFYGAGQVLIDLLGKYSFVDWENYICTIVDGSHKKQGEKFVLNGMKYEIISPDCMIYYDFDVIVITAQDIVGIFNQLSQLSFSQNPDITTYKLIHFYTEKENDISRKYPKSFKVFQKKKIPAVIHYCWFGKSDIPQQYLEYMKSWKRYCPTYEIKRWDENNYDISWNKYMVDAYERKKWQFVSDVARLDIVYREGGIYLDTDVELLKNIDDLLYQRAFFGVEDTWMVNTGLGFGAEKQHESIKRLLSIYDNMRFIESDKAYMVPCPRLQNKAFREIGYSNNGEFFQTKDLVIYPVPVLCGKSLYTGKSFMNKYTFSIHHYSGSWDDSRKKL